VKGRSSISDLPIVSNGWEPSDAATRASEHPCA